MIDYSEYEALENNIKRLDPDQKKLFAWRSALRALPFLGSQGHFNFWQPDQIAEHLYKLFYTFDAVFEAPRSIPIEAILEAEEDTIYFMDFRSDQISDSHPIAAAAMDGLDYETFCQAGSVAESVVSAIAQLAPCRYAYPDAVSVIVSSVVAAVSESEATIDIKNIINQDLLDIQKGIVMPIEMADYGEIWPNFKEALQKNACQYWISWYENLAKDGYIKDKEQLKKRVNIPPILKECRAQAVARFLEDIAETGERFNESRLVILGEKGVGKTSIARKLKNPTTSMMTAQESTQVVEVSHWNLDKKLAVQIWDFAGDTLADAIHQFFQMERCLYLLVCDKLAKLEQIRHWLDLIKDFGAVSKVIILVNERGEEQLQLPLEALKKVYPIVAIHSLDIANDKEKWPQIRSTIIAHLRHNPAWKKQLVPNKYYAIKDDLQQQLNEQNKPYFTWNEYLIIAEKQASHDSWFLSRILKYYELNLWEEKIGDNTLFFDPQWIAQGLYTILNWAKKEAEISITLAQFSEVFANNRDRYPEAEDKVLFELLQRYELAYKKPKNNGLRSPNLLRIPYLYNWDDEEVLHDFSFDPVKDLIVKFEAHKNFPPNVMSRFISLHNHQMPGRVWQHGVLLRIDDALALVIQKGSTITIYVEGKKKTDFLVELRATFLKIFKDYSIPTPELYYQVYDTDCFLAESEICELLLAEKTFYYEPIQQAIPMAPIVLKYGITDDTIFFPGNSQENHVYNIVSTAKLVTQLREDLQKKKEELERERKWHKKNLKEAEKKYDNSRVTPSPKSKMKWFYRLFRTNP